MYFKEKISYFLELISPDKLSQFNEIDDSQVVFKWYDDNTIEHSFENFSNNYSDIVYITTTCKSEINSKIINKLLKAINPIFSNFILHKPIIGVRKIGLKWLIDQSLDIQEWIKISSYHKKICLSILSA